MAAELGAEENGLLLGGVDRAPEDEPGRGFRKGEAVEWFELSMAAPVPLDANVEAR